MYVKYDQYFVVDKQHAMQFQYLHKGTAEYAMN